MEEGGDTVHGGEEGEVEELDYDETMEDLDLHPTGNIDEGDGDETRKQSVASDSRPEEKKWRISHRSEDTSSKLPRSLANRLGPSPGLHGRIGKRSDRSNSGHHKGSALAIAAEYKRRKQAGELSPREAARATMITKRINESERNKPAKHRKLEERSEENERELDKRIDSIKQMNKALEKRHKEIEEDKQLYG
jgi:hypothetical protein